MAYFLKGFHFSLPQTRFYISIFFPCQIKIGNEEEKERQ
jgi:hypothetical protein